MVIVITDKKNSKKNPGITEPSIFLQIGRAPILHFKDFRWNMVWNGMKPWVLSPKLLVEHGGTINDINDWLKGKFDRKHPYIPWENPWVSAFDCSLSQSIETMIPPSNLGVSDWQNPPGCSLYLGTKVGIWMWQFEIIYNMCCLQCSINFYSIFGKMFEHFYKLL